MTDIHSIFARNLKRIRLEKELTQIELAEKAGVNRSYLASIESENITNTSLKTVEKLAVALGVSILELLGSPKNQETK